ncbi:MAG: 3-isopropylmalate dehydratase small subunit [Spirochaetaceae bacterium]|jgi:3-isopropylmalate/(R)-2-methylmalate dehydratase small subunit|nr:3-isopropylmalate dehydratase small subunit [Spirochaetaceae bacterium]
MDIFKGRCWKFGDNIPTDQIVRAERVLLTIDEMKQYVLENYNPNFAREVQAGDILVAGKHFGQSSGRAVAPKALKATGIGLVIVEYAARLFYRNAFETGLPLLECPGIHDMVSEGDIVEARLETGLVSNLSTGRTLQARPIAPFLMEMLRAGGLIEMAPRLERMTV